MLMKHKFDPLELKLKSQHNFTVERVRRFRKRQILFTLFLIVCFYYIVFNELLYGEGETRKTPRVIVLVEGWNYNTSRNVSHYITANNNTLILMPRTFCESPSFLLVIVCSSPVHQEARNAIRRTWASESNISNVKVSYYFLLGETQNNTLQREIIKESEIHGDIIQDDFVDTYNNLTLKTVIMMKLVSTYCANSTRFLLKIDDDIFLRTDAFVAILKGRKEEKNVILGNLMCNSKPIKDIHSKWYAPTYMYSEKVYPNYVSGTAYVMSIDVVPKLYSAALQTPLFHLEDVYITGICSQRVNVTPHHHRGFTYRKQRFDPCFFKEAFTFHDLTPRELLERYHYQKTVTNLIDACFRYRVKFSSKFVAQAQRKRRLHKNCV